MRAQGAGNTALAARLGLSEGAVSKKTRTAPGGRGYQTEINRALRQHVQRSENA